MLTYSYNAKRIKVYRDHKPVATIYVRANQDVFQVLEQLKKFIKFN